MFITTAIRRAAVGLTLLLGLTIAATCTAYKYEPKATATDGTYVAGHSPAVTAYVTVDNQNWNLVRIYVSENGNTPIRLGSVETGRRETLPFRVQEGARYLFTIIPLASDAAYTTEGIAVEAGDTLRLGVASMLSFTTVYRQTRIQ